MTRPLVAALIALAGVSEPGWSQGTRRANINHAEARLRLGEFSEAQEIAAAVLDKDPSNLRAALVQARVALLGNRLDDAEGLAERAAELRPTHRVPKEILAEVHYRRGEFARAAELFADLGKETKAAKLASFEARRPYAGSGRSAPVEVTFVQTDPLPVAMVGVNGSQLVAFILDTGAGEVILDKEWAAEIGVESFGEETGTFGGGRQAAYGHGRAESLVLGELELRDVPVQLLDTTPFSAVAPGREIRGVLGTVLFYQFLTTIDYPGGRLILEPRSGQRTTPSDTPVARIPFWLADDHFIVARGSVNAAEPALFLVDTGLAGLGFTCPRSTLDDAEVDLLEVAAVEGVGGAGLVQIVPFVLESLSLGDLRREQIPGVFGPFPPTLEHSKGFRIGGLVSHGFFRPYAVSFDFDGMEIIVRTPS